MKKRIKLSGVIVALVVVTLLILPSLFSWKQTAEMLLTQIEEESNLSINLLGDIEAGILPPQFTLYDLTVQGNTPYGPLDMEIPSLTGHCSLVHIFMLSCKVSTVTLTQPSVKILQYGRESRRRMQHDAEAAEEPAFLSLPVHIDSGTLTLAQASGAEPNIFSDITVTFSMNSEQRSYQIAGSFDRFGNRINVDAAMNPGAEGQPGNLKLKLGNAQSSVTYDGSMQDTDNGLSMDGALHLSANDLALTSALIAKPRTHLRTGIKSSATEGEAQKSTPSTVELSTPPVTLDGTLHFKDNLLTVKDAVMQVSEDSTLKFSLSSRTSLPIKAALGIKAETVQGADVYPVLLVLNRMARNLRYNEEEEKLSIKADYFTPVFPEDSRMNLSFAAEKFLWNAEAISDIAFKAELKGGEWVVDTAKGTLPYDTPVALQGIIGEVKGGFRFDGKSEATGPSLRNVLQWMGMQTEGVPEGRMGAFSIASGFSFQPGEIRITDGEIRIDDYDIKGTILLKEATAKSNFIPSIDLTLAFDTFDIDQYLPPDSIYPTPDDLNPVIDDDRRVPEWLHDIPVEVHITSSIRHATFRSVPFEILRTRMKISPDKMLVHSVSGVHDKSPFNGKMLLKTGNARPFVNVVFLGGAINANLLTQLIHAKPLDEIPPRMETEPAPGDEDTVWSSTPLDTYLIDMWDGKFAIEMKKLTVGEVAFENLSTKGVIDNHTLTFKKFQTDMLGGKLVLDGFMKGGSVPHIEFEVGAFDLDADQFLQLKTDIDVLKGELDLNGTVQSRGVSPLSLVRNLEAHMKFNATDVTAQEFDLNALSRKITTVRKVEDVVSLSRLALAGGNTKLDQVWGLIAVKEGQLQVPQGQLKAEHSEGQLVSAMDLSTLLSNVQVSFRPLSRATDNIPMIHLKLSGKLDKPKRQLDTKDLQDFVAKRAVKKRF